VVWDDLNATQQSFQMTKMAIHAAMVDRMDHEIGRIVEQLTIMNVIDNTLILFLSDNGASAEIMVRDDGHDPAAPPGSAATHLCLGPGWSTVSNTPFRRHKTWVHEGGISTPLIAHWPKGIAARGGIRTDVGHVIDIVPTVLELAQGKPPVTWQGVAVPAPPGQSLVSSFISNDSIHRNSVWWLHEGNRALRMDQWKIVAAKGEPWELYDMHTDRAEQHNRSVDNGDLVNQLETEWKRLTNEFTVLSQESK
jgi:arylsulfatase